MARKRIVVALGGNALGKTPEEQLSLITHTAETIVDLIEAGEDVIVTHGNGPQVGMIKVATDTAHEVAGTASIPFPECGAMSQGYIGYHLQQAIDGELSKRGISRQCLSIITQTEVARDDPAFHKPTKPVGAFFTKEAAEKEMKETGKIFVEDAGRGWRWVVASPLPVKIIEAPTIAQLVDAGTVVIACGGGGVPVIAEGGGYVGVPAVIDKDRSAALLAEQVSADTLLILTATDGAYKDYGTADQTIISTMNIDEAENAVSQGWFAEGSMLPKIDACISFVRNVPAGVAIVSSLERARDALEGKTGTRITEK